MKRITLIAATLFLSMLPVATLAQAGGQPERRPISELLAVRQETARAADAENPGLVLRQLLLHGNPRTLGRALRDGYRNREFLSTQGTVHSRPREAIAQSIAPLAGRANTRAAVKSGLRPANLAVDIGVPLATEAAREFIQDGRIDPDKFGEQVRPAALAGGLTGGLAGNVAGAAVQSALAGSMGPFGSVAGFVARPMIAWSAGMLGARWADGAAHGKPSLKDAFRDSIRAIEPGRDIGSIVGGTVGTVVGQALIPIPGVGAFAGGMVGTLLGGWIGGRFASNSPAGAIKGGLKSLLGKSPSRQPSSYQVGQSSYQPMAGLASN